MIKIMKITMNFFKLIIKRIVIMIILIAINNENNKYNINTNKQNRTSNCFNKGKCSVYDMSITYGLRCFCLMFFNSVHF